MNKPELLLPAGNAEMFHAAVEGGADAVYLGLKQFNARERADNFTIPQLQALLAEAGKHNIKVYLTLNTVIKNKELPELLDILHAVSQTDISAVIMQDWGLYYLIRNHFSNLKLHASTQMGNHNAPGGMFSEKLGFERVIFARELTKRELAAIREKSNIQIELFIHGALCYSFSGMCLFSSYLGGMSANRGKCMQPCRRMYHDQNQKKYLFSLKDNQLIDHIPEIMDMGISSLKVEGRLKSAEYVYQVARAYRMAIDHPERIDEAAQLLIYDTGREKTAYYLGGDVNGALTENPSTGIFLGTVEELTQKGFILQTNEPIRQGNRLWIRSPKGENRKALKVKSFEKDWDEKVIIHSQSGEIQKGDLVYLANLRQKKFSDKFTTSGKEIMTSLPANRKQNILQSLAKPGQVKKTQLFVRIDSIKWLKKIPFQEVDNIIINLAENEWKELDVNAFLIKKNAHKIFFELPKIIPEGKIAFYRSLFKKYGKQGYRNFMISHLSQKLILPEHSTIAANENVYVFNDAAIHFLRKENIKLFCYPLENDLDNLFEHHNKKGIIPVYFYPELFYSRMPVHIRDKDHTFKDDKNYSFKRIRKNGMTIIVPGEPVSLTQHKNKLDARGFGRYLIDLTYEKPSDKRLHTILQKLRQSEQIQPSNTFNFKKGLS
ncbi:MAG: peptidase U32 family protein [Bacteroidales bacterium]